MKPAIVSLMHVLFRICFGESKNLLNWNVSYRVGELAESGVIMEFHLPRDLRFEIAST